MSALSPASILFDVNGNAVAVIQNNAIYRLETRSKLSGQVQSAGAEVDVTVIPDSALPNEHRLQVESRQAPGSTINIGTGIPSDPANLVIEFVSDADGLLEDMLVDASGGDVVYEYQPGVGKIVAVESLLVVFTADDFDFDGVSFGSLVSLVSGIKFEVKVGGITDEIFVIKQNEDFMRVPGRIPVINNTGPKDLLAVAFGFGGLLQLSQANDDKILVTIRDDLEDVRLRYLTCTVYGAEID